LLQGIAPGEEERVRARFALLLVSLISLSACNVGEDPAPDSRAGEGLGTDTGEVGSLAARVCADGTTTSGVDVSYYNGAIDWAKAKAAGVQFAFIRVSDGTGFKDPKFATYWAGAKSAGVLRGAYQFFRPAQDPIAQADLFVDTMGPLGEDDLPPVIDVEATGSLSPSSVAARVSTWVERVRARTGRTPIVYTGKYFWRDQVGGSTAQASSALWVAQYTTLCPDLPAPWTRWTFWQYSESGSMPGIPGDVDMDRFNGTLDDLRAFAHGGALYKPFGVAWTRASTGVYSFSASSVPAGVAKVSYYIDDYLIGAGDASTGFAINYTFNYAKSQRLVEARGTDASGKQIALSIGLIDSIPDTAVFIRQVGANRYEIGLERAPAGVAAIEVAADGILLTDEQSSTTRSARGAVMYTFSQLGARTFTIRTYDSAGALRGTLTRTFTLR
jgi:GH25 family lysozyme M1 (1,4-beta-N-acetylmuramidase)